MLALQGAHERRRTRVVLCAEIRAAANEQRTCFIRTMFGREMQGSFSSGRVDGIHDRAVLDQQRDDLVLIRPGGAVQGAEAVLVAAVC